MHLPTFTQLITAILGGSSLCALECRAASESLIPADKKLSQQWIQSLSERGEPPLWRGKELRYIGMPVGGIGCGQLYLSGDGRLWLWDIFKSNYDREPLEGMSLAIPSMGGNYSQPMESEGELLRKRNGAPVEQGFAIHVKSPAGESLRSLDRHGFPDVAFRGEYPLGRVSYRDPESPVTVDLEAFSPFIPLNAKDSALPATVMAYTVTNTSQEPVQINLHGYLQNSVNPYDSDPVLGKRVNTLVTAKNLSTLSCAAIGNPELPKDVRGLETRHGHGSMALSIMGGKPDELRGNAELQLPLGSNSIAADFQAGATAEKAFGQKLVGSIGRALTLAPGDSQTVTFLVTWYFPLHQERGGILEKLKEGETVSRHYKPWFESAADVASHVAENFERLAGDTRLWNRTWYDSTLPYWLLDRAMIPVDALATQTFLWFDNGRPWGWEGVDVCEGTCTHVWNYAQAMARLFPEFERTVRETVDYGIAYTQDGTAGKIGNRAEHDMKPAIDGQAGTIVRTWREHTMSSDDAFLTRVWPRTKAAIEYLILQDPDQDGVIDGAQSNTLDATWYGPMGWISSTYCAALRAGEQMAAVMGDEEFATRCRQIADRGMEAIVKKTFNGEFFAHLPPDTKHINSGKGSHIDQVLGQSWAMQTGLPRVLPKAETESALNALWKYNFTPDAGGYAIKHTPIKGHRVYAHEGEAGMVMTGWPRGGAETAVPGMDKLVEDFKTWIGPGGYFDECMTGFEYQVAAHMLYEGEPGSELVTRGLAVARAVDDRYAPAKRNPYNEIECGNHYARAMASYGVLLGACGFEYDGPKAHIGFAPRLTPDDFRAPFTAAEGWGTFSQQREAGNLRAGISVKSGKLRLKTISLSLITGQKPESIKVTIEDKLIDSAMKMEDGRILITLADPVVLRPGRDLQIMIPQ